MTEPTPTTVTPASEWRRVAKEGELYRLPGSGNVARLIRPSLTALVSVSSGVPNPLSRDVQKLITGAAPTQDEAKRWENYVANSRAMQEVAQLCLKEPRLVLDREPGEGEIGPADLTDLDYSWLYYTFVEGGAADVAPFRVTARSHTD